MNVAFLQLCLSANTLISSFAKKKNAIVKNKNTKCKSTVWHFSSQPPGVFIDPALMSKISLLETVKKTVNRLTEPPTFSTKANYNKISY